jgi:hypothetical protein
VLPINIMLDSTFNSQEAFMAITYANEMNAVSENTVNLFTMANSLPVIKPNCAILPIEKALYTKGVNIATSFHTAKFLRSCIAEKKVFYVWEPTWIFNKMDYLTWYKIFNEDIKLIARCREHAKCIYNLSGKRVRDIVPNFNLRDILDVAKQ